MRGLMNMSLIQTGACEWRRKKKAGWGWGEMGRKKNEDTDGKEPVLALQPFLWRVLLGSLCGCVWFDAIYLCSLPCEHAHHAHMHRVLKHMCISEEDIECLPLSLPISQNLKYH